MALGKNIKHGPYVKGDRREVIVDITLNAYATGGVALLPGDVGLGTIHDVQPSIATNGSGAAGTLAVALSYDYTNQKLQAWKSNTAANMQEVADAADLSLYVGRLIITGR